ncbi:hypothetical protein BMS3Bbin13_00039 [bacterium BMS3Bbin13]|nr:hypothetical protein BMS3Bbin13_00039 [bacterium BMS3Bbin13]
MVREGDCVKTPKIQLRFPAASRGRGLQSVDLAVRLGDGWQVFRVQAGESVRRISLEEAGPEVVRCSPGDRVLHLPGLSGGKIRETLMRELRSIPTYRRWGTWVVACPRSEAAIAGRRVRPLAAAVAEKAPAHPSIVTMRVGDRLAVMWPVGKDGSVGACEVAAVESDADLEEFAGNLAAVVGLEGAQILPLEAVERWLPGFVLPVYPQEGEWFGRPVVWYARGFAAVAALLMVAVGLQAGTAHHRLERELGNSAQEKVRLRDAQRALERWNRGHVNVVAHREAIDFTALTRVAQVLWHPGVRVSLEKGSLIVNIGSSQLTGVAGVGFREPAAQMLRRVFATPTPKGWRRIKVTVRNGGSFYEVEYGRKNTSSQPMVLGGRHLPPGPGNILRGRGGA